MSTHIDPTTERSEAEADARRAIVRALNRAPYDVWTGDSLARTLALSPGLTGRILAQLATAGMVHLLEGTDDEYTVAGDDLIGA
jgi:DNA-binding IscR family transcriptional regulator